MGAGSTYVMLTLGAGALLLLGWAYVTTDNPRSTPMLAKSVWLFVLPMIVLIALPDAVFAFPLSLWVGVLIEEGLKANAARTERASMDKFWLVSLYGLWELAIAKPINGLGSHVELAEWGRWEILGLVAATALPALMHTVTAAIYAFHLKGRLWLQLLVAWALHVTFNEMVDLFGPSPWSSGGQFVVLLILLALLWPDPKATMEANDAAPT